MLLDTSCIVGPLVRRDPLLYNSCAYVIMHCAIHVLMILYIVKYMCMLLYISYIFGPLAELARVPSFDLDGVGSIPALLPAWSILPINHNGDVKAVC